MRKFSPFLFLPLLAFAAQGASFTNGQAARAVIGQNGFTDAYALIDSNNVFHAQQNILGGASGLAYANGFLYVADSNRIGAVPLNNRVLVFPTTQIPRPQDDPSDPKFAHSSPECWLCGFQSSAVIGQQDYTTNLAGRDSLPNSSGGSLNAPVAVAVSPDGRTFAIADTNNNRVLIWNTPPTNQNTPPNVVLGQTDFKAFASPQVTSSTSLRGPQGVWIQNGKLFVADTQNHRVLIWNNTPTQNNQPADVVLGQPNFNSANQPPPTSGNSPNTAANQLYSPTSVTVSPDGTHLFVADLGSNRVLIWNSIPTRTAQGADVVIGQPDMTTSVSNWNTQLCGYNTVNTVVLPDGSFIQLRAPCEATLNSPRFALSDGTRLFIADGGNDRVLIFNSIPTTNGAKADAVLGQPDFTSDIVTNQAQSIASTAIDNTSSVDTTPTPTSLAFDGTNLYVSDPFNRRVLLFAVGDVSLPSNSVVNWASEIIRQEGVIAIALTSGGTITANDTVTATIAGTAYTYTVQTNDTLDAIARGLVNAINSSNNNSGDPNVTALFSGAGTGSLYLSSKGINLSFDAISLAATASNTVNLTVTTSGGYLSAGTAATASPGMLIEINGANLTDQSINPDPGVNISPLLNSGVQVFIDGFPAPIYSLSPTRIVTQIPFSVNGTDFASRNSASIYVRTQHNGGSTTVSNATPAYIAPANPGLFNQPQSVPRPWPAAGAKHQLYNPSAVVSIDGSIKAGDTATITVNGVNYTYTITANDTLGSVAGNLTNQINADANAPVGAYTGGAFSRVVVVAKASGAAGTGIPISGSTSSSAQVSVTAYTSSTCCNVTNGSDITSDNPAVPGETIQVAAAGLGALSDGVAAALSVAGQPYNGPGNNNVSNSVSATMNNVTAQVVTAGLQGGSYGIYTVQLIVPSNIANTNAAQLYIAQNAFVSNIVTLPVGPAAGPLPTPTPTSTPTPTPAAPTCTFLLSSTTLNFSVSGNSGVLGVNAPNGCAWTASSNNSDWLTVSSGSSGSGGGTVAFGVASNTGTNVRTGTLTVAGQTVTVTQAGTSTPLPTALRFVPVTPCRVADTRGASSPIISGGSTRDFSIPASNCGIPSSAAAYALNVTVVPVGPLTYLTVWQSGAQQPFVSTLNSYDGRIKANAAIIPAGTNGAVSVFATDSTHVVLDIDGYFVPATNPSALAFFPLPPCRVADTRGSASPLGGPSLAAGQPRALPIRSSACNIPTTASAYALNFTAVPKGSLNYLTVWPGGQNQPFVSTLNSPTGTVVANEAIVPAGTNGDIAVYASDSTDLVIDVNGYFAPPAAGGLSLYNVPPCRVLDTRLQAGQQPVQGATNTNIATSGCGVPTSGVGGYVLNATAVPQSTLNYLTLWSPDQAQQPFVSTLNAYDGKTASNLALVPSSTNVVNLFTTDSAHLILDLFGYFAQ